MKIIFSFMSVFAFISLGFTEELKYCGYDEVMEQVESAHPGFKASADFVFEERNNKNN